MTSSTGCSREAKKERAIVRAEQYFERKEYDKAKLEYANVLQIDTTNAVALKKLGICWQEQGAALRALPFLSRSKELAPMDMEVRIRLATAFLTVGSRSSASKEAHSILEIQPDNEKAILLIADAAASRDENEKVRERLTAFPKKNCAAFQVAYAAVLSRSGEIDGARTALAEALRFDPKEPLAHLLLAGLDFASKNLTEATRGFKIGSELAPVRSVFRLRYAEFKFKAGELEEATKLVAAIIKEAPDYFPALQLQAQVSLAQRNLGDAMKHLDSVLRRDPDNLESRMLQAQVSIAKGEIDKAVENLERLDKAHPNVPVLKFELGKALNLQGNASSAITALASAVNAAPEYENAVLLLNELRLRKGDTEAAIHEMQSFCRAKPGSVGGKLLLADAYRLMGRLSDAVEVYRQLLLEAPSRPRIHSFLGATLRQMGNLDEAEKSFEEAMKAEPKNLGPLAELVELDIRRKNYDGALRRVATHSGGRTLPEHMLIQGRIEVARAQWDRAEAILLQAVEANPDQMGAYELLIRTYIATQRLEKAAVQAEALAAKKPRNSRALMLAGMLYNHLGEEQKAIDIYERIIAEVPDFVPAINNLACLYVKQAASLDRAYELAKKARVLQPTDPAVADTFGWVLYHRREFPQALALLRESASRLLEHPEVQYHLGMAHYVMGHREAAAAALGKAALAPDDFPGKKEIERRLQILSKPHELSTAALMEIAKRESGDVFALFQLGEKYQESGEFSRAGEVLENALKTNPQMLPGLVRLAELYGGPLGNPVRAMELARRARELAPDDPSVAIVLGKLEYQTGNINAAYSLLRESAGNGGNDSDPVPELAIAAYGIGRTEEAINVMLHLAKRASDSKAGMEARNFLEMVKLGADTTALQGRIAEVNGVLETDPGNIPALMTLGIYEHNKGNIQKAIECYARVLHRFPDFAPAQKQLAAAYLLDPAQLEKAYDYAVKARKTLPEDLEVLTILAEASFGRKEYAYTKQLLEECSRQRVLEPKQLFFLGVAYFELKNEASAQKLLQQALDAGLPQPFVEQARNILSELEKREKKKKHVLNVSTINAG